MLFADELGHLAAVAGRWVPVAHSSTTRSGPTPSRASSARSGGRTVRLGMGRVRSGKTTATESRAPHQVGQRRAGDRRPQGVEDGPTLVGEAGEIARGDHGGVVGDACHQSPAAVGQADLLHGHPDTGFRTGLHHGVRRPRRRPSAAGGSA